MNTIVDPRINYLPKPSMNFTAIAVIVMGFVVVASQRVGGELLTHSPRQPVESSPSSFAIDLTADDAETTLLSSPRNFSTEGAGPKSEEAPELVEGAVERTPRHRFLHHRGRRSPSVSGEGRRRRRGRGRAAASRELEAGGGGGGGREGSESPAPGSSSESTFPDVVEDDGVVSTRSTPAQQRSHHHRHRYHRNCTTRSCVIREEAKRIRLEVIKAQILQKLRLTHVPNITRMDVPRLPSPIEHLIDEYGRDGRHGSSFAAAPPDEEGEYDEDEDDDDFHATTTKVIKFGEKLPADKTATLSNDASNTVYFEFQPQSLRAKVLHAQLYVYVRKPPSGSRGSTLLLVYKMPLESSSKPELVCSRAVELRTGRRWNHWQSCDVKQTVEDFLHIGQRNFSLKVVLNDHSGRPLAVLHPNQSNDDRKPFIEVETRPQRGNRKKRMIGINCEEGNTEEKRCCRYKLTVDFDSFGWDWILAPKRYEAYYCAGECPFVFLQRYTHTHIIQQANPYGVGGPCCTPTRMSPVQLLYYDDRREIITGILPDMAVDRCGCA